MVCVSLFVNKQHKSPSTKRGSERGIRPTKHITVTYKSLKTEHFFGSSFSDPPLGNSDAHRKSLPEPPIAGPGGGLQVAARIPGVDDELVVPGGDLPEGLKLPLPLSLSLSLSLSLPLGASIAQLVKSRSWTRKALSSIPAPATIEWVTKKSSPKSLRRNLKPEIPQVFRTSAAPVQE